MVDDECRTPGELLAAGVTALPCGFRLVGGKAGFLERLRHYKTCSHPYCTARLSATKELTRQLAAGMKLTRAGGGK